MAILGCAGALAMAGCSGSRGGGVPTGSAELSATAVTRTASGDWDDLDAAVEVGGDQAEWVIHRKWTEGEGGGVRMYELRDAAGRVAVLRIRKAAAGERVELTATIGPLGNARAEQRLVDSVARRLEQLRGVEVAPIR